MNSEDEAIVENVEESFIHPELARYKRAKENWLRDYIPEEEWDSVREEYRASWAALTDKERESAARQWWDEHARKMQSRG